MKSLVLFSCFFLFSFLLSAQSNVPNGPGLLPYVKHFQTGINYVAAPSGEVQDLQFQIPATGFSGTVTWRYCVGGGCSLGVLPASVTLANGLTLSRSGNTATISGTPTTAADITLVLQASISVPAESGQRTFRLITREPNDIVFALDRSGSMECAVNDWSWPCPTPMTDRWTVLKNSINIFMSKLQTGSPTVGNDYKVKGDRLSVVYFEGNVMDGTSTLYSDPFITDGLAAARFKDVIGFKAGISANMDAQENRGGAAEKLGRTGTGIGNGLLNAIQTKHAYTGAVTNKRRVVVLLTDGEQNAAPLVEESGANAGKQVGAFTWSNAVGDHIEVHSIGFGSLPPSHPLLMNNISSSGNTYITSNGIDYAIGATMGIDVFNNIFKAYSPQLIASTTLTNPPADFSQTFPVNNNVSRLFFEAHFDGEQASRYKFRVLRDGQDVTQFAQADFGQTYALFTFNFAHILSFGSKGDWVLECKYDNYDLVKMVQAPIADRHVILAATADDHDFKFEQILDKPKYIVGDKLGISARFTKNGQPIDNATVTATILKPGDDWGDVVARATTPSLPLPNKETGSIGQVKYAYLEANSPDITDKIDVKKFNNTLTLQYASDGMYKANYTQLDLSGVYQIVYKVKYSTPEDGMVERTVNQSIVVRFGELDLNLATQTMEEYNDGGFYSYELQYTPAYQSGSRTLLVGPSFERSIRAEGNGVTLHNVEDKGDGSYTFRLKGNKRNPKVNLFFYGEEFYRGAVKRFNKPYFKYPFNISVHGGFTRPLLDLDSTYNNSFFVEADLGYRLSRKWAVELVGGYYDFKSDFNIVGITFYGKMYVDNYSNGGGISIAAGGGYFKPSLNQGTGGLSARAAWEWHFSPRFSINAGISGFLLPAYEYSFLGIGLGAKLHF